MRCTTVAALDVDSKRRALASCMRALGVAPTGPYAVMRDCDATRERVVAPGPPARRDCVGGAPGKAWAGLFIVKVPFRGVAGTPLAERDARRLSAGAGAALPVTEVAEVPGTRRCTRGFSLGAPPSWSRK